MFWSFVFLYWADGEPNDANEREDCTIFYGDSSNIAGWNDVKCDEDAIPTAICDSPYWFSDQTRTFQLNFEETFDEVILMSISNSGTNSLCIDSITGKRITTDHDNDLASKQIGTYWIYFFFFFGFWIKK